jgi:hypothetical protein
VPTLRVGLLGQRFGSLRSGPSKLGSNRNTFLNGTILANLVILDRASHKDKSALLFEGDTDGRIYRRFIDPLHCRPFSSKNRAIAEEALGILKSAAEKGVLAIVDADTDHLTNTISTDPDLRVTHTRDAEGMLLQSQALQNVLVEFDVEGNFGVDPHVTVIEAAALVGYMKFIVLRNKWNACTTQLDFAKFANPMNLRCDIAKLCSHMEDLTITPGITAVDYTTELDSLKGLGIDATKVARGHDATSLLAWAIPIVAGKKRKNGALIEAHVVESYLRTAYPDEAFSKCEMHQKIFQWEVRNEPYRVLKR